MLGQGGKICDSRTKMQLPHSEGVDHSLANSRELQV